MIFVDTGAWFASIITSDINHVPAKQWLKSNKQALITTDYVIDETLTLLRARGYSESALALGEKFFRGDIATIHFLSKDDILETWNVFRYFSDKDWSFTDCTSKVVINKLQLKQAFTFDHHFDQFGSVTVVPT